MSIDLNREQRRLLNNLSKRINNEHIIWFNCSLNPSKGEKWICFICNNYFKFKESFSEIDAHGLEHLKQSNLLPFI